MQYPRLLTLVLVLTLIVGYTPAVFAHGSSQCTSTHQAMVTAEEPFSFLVYGESPHWVVVLLGNGRCRAGQVTLAQAQPIVIWAGGTNIPDAYSVAFKVHDLECLRGMVSQKTTKADIQAMCKLLYPNQPSIPGKTPEDFVRAIMSDGKFVLEWDNRQETINWVYGNPPPRK